MGPVLSCKRKEVIMRKLKVLREKKGIIFSLRNSFRAETYRPRCRYHRGQRLCGDNQLDRQRPLTPVIGFIIGASTSKASSWSSSRQSKGFRKRSRSISEVPPADCRFRHHRGCRIPPREVRQPPPQEGRGQGGRENEGSGAPGRRKGPVTYRIRDLLKNSMD